MKTDFIFAVLLIAVGTYLIRAVPFVLSSRSATEKKNRTQIQLFFQLMGPSIIAALLVVSLESPLEPGASSQLVNAAFGFAGVTVSRWLWNNSGISVLAGIVCFTAALLV
ncbi:MAG: AzlD domain-containing protein [SAR324 cluster bacterium]|nr:AzlD domain-containing protein [SAR324 cluster bacterium]MBL7034957.1 AzlD domain-containing protein [SAR324 cluster bacterium]